MQTTILPSPIDLTSINGVKSWLSANGQPNASTSDDANIQACITALSAEFLWRTGRGPRSNVLPTQSPYVEPVSFSETYDGNGHDQLFLRNAPIQSVQSLMINGVSIPQSTGYGVFGFAIADDGRSLYMIHGSGAILSTRLGFGHHFSKGRQNVSVQYTAGYGVVSQIQDADQIPQNSPFTLQPDGPWLSDGGVQDQTSGSPYTLVQNAPAQGQYSVTSGLYTFNSADANKTVVITYTTGDPPDDIELAVRKWVALNYKRRQWIDQKSQAMAQGAGTITLRDWEFSPDIQALFKQYKRYAVV